MTTIITTISTNNNQQHHQQPSAPTKTTITTISTNNNHHNNHQHQQQPSEQPSALIATISAREVAQGTESKNGCLTWCSSHNILNATKDSCNRLRLCRPMSIPKLLSYPLTSLSTFQITSSGQMTCRFSLSFLNDPTC